MGATGKQPMKPYDSNKIPAWCTMTPAEHECAGGCWAILGRTVNVGDPKTCGKCAHVDKAKLPEEKKS